MKLEVFGIQTNRPSKGIRIKVDRSIYTNANYNTIPKVIDEKRLCSHPGCKTILSRYNKTKGDKAKCFTHDKGIPRLRGRNK